ncbi:hypothetical protein J7L84_01225 [Candidatus Bipolaricaulota bacterium]|nr:hypothetical protein [Candidatus Bipolaricaulota bacterium]
MLLNLEELWRVIARTPEPRPGAGGALRGGRGRPQRGLPKEAVVAGGELRIF